MSFAQTLYAHVSACSDASREVRDALAELRALGREHRVCLQRGAKRAFIERVWKRMTDYCGEGRAAGDVGSEGQKGEGGA